MRDAAKSLQLFISPLPLARFFRERFLASRPHCSRGRLERLPLLSQSAELQNLDALLGRAEWVFLLGKNGFRSRVPSAVARDFYERGDTLYLTDLEHLLPEFQPLLKQIAIALGMAAASGSMEAFATKRAGAAASFHYDHDWNFQIMLRGKKEWRLCPNHHLRYPLRPLHRLNDPPEEAFAHRLPLLKAWRAGHRLWAKAGDVLFLPAGYWHETTALSETFAVNLVFRPMRQAEALGHCITARLLGHASFRAPALSSTTCPSAPLMRANEKTHAELIRAAHQLLDQLKPEDLALAGLNPIYRWRPGVAKTLTPGQGKRSATLRVGSANVRIDPAIFGLVDRIKKFRGSFSCEQMSILAPDLTYPQVLNFCKLLEESGCFLAVE